MFYIEIETYKEFYDKLESLRKEALFDEDSVVQYLIESYKKTLFEFPYSCL